MTQIHLVAYPTRTPRIYLAGKITPNRCWRSRFDPHNPDRPFSCDNVLEAINPHRVVSLPTMKIVGPFFVSCDHGCAHGAQTHGVAGGCIDGGLDLADLDDVRKHVHAANIARIKRADFIFAVIDEVDCFGTIAEIGVAHGLGKPTHLFFGENLTLEQRYDLWFVARCATHVYERISLEHAFDRALKLERSA